LLTFQNDSFNLIVISSTSHHSVTPEKLFSEIHRVLLSGGKCLVINDPTRGIIKNLSGPNNTKEFREGHINENEYSIWHYNKIFRKNVFKSKHYFSEFYDDKLLNMSIDSRTRFYFVAKILKRLWSIDFFRIFFKKYVLWWGQAIFSLPMNVILTK
jgi:SAM-dependent methyltransferase